MKLLPRELLIKTSAVDRADWNYGSVLAGLQRRRFELLLSMMAGRKAGRLLELGYGSGILLPELADRCDELFGADPHDRHGEVRALLAEHDIHAMLVSASAERLPFDDAFFDTVVAVSAIEYVEDIDAACRELCRVLVPNGNLYVVTPGYSPLLDLMLRLVTGESANENYGRRRERLLPALALHFRTLEIKLYPPLFGRLLPVYRALRLTPLSSRNPGARERARSGSSSTMRYR